MDYFIKETPESLKKARDPCEETNGEHSPVQVGVGLCKRVNIG